MNELETLGQDLLNYCNKYKIPSKYIFEILNNQKVVPMIRGKATEFNAYVLLVRILNESEWSVQKLNLNAQLDTYDEDISVTHKRTGIILKVECKNAVRGSMVSGKRSRNAEVPHCLIKCHRSRSNMRKTTNDRYSVDSFDVILTNLSNSIIKGATYGEEFELIDKDKDIINILAKHYSVKPNYHDLFGATLEDWRFALTMNIAEDGYLPRTPILRLENDPNWKGISEIENSLLDLVRYKKSTTKKEKIRKR